AWPACRCRRAASMIARIAAMRRRHCRGGGSRMKPQPRRERVHCLPCLPRRTYMEYLLPYGLEWLNLLVRWLHVITGIAWIGASFYFVWLDNSIRPPAP